MGDDEPAFLAVEPGYKNVLRFRLGIVWLFITAGALILDRALLRQLGFGGFLPLVALAIAAAVVIIAPQRIYRRLRYRLTGQVLQVLRGWLFHTDTVVPLVRVQHLDVIRGPFDKLSNLSIGEPFAEEIGAHPATVGGHRRVENATTKLSRYATSGTIHTSGSATTFWLMCVVVAARSSDAHAASATHSTRVLRATVADSTVAIPCPSSAVFRTDAPMTPARIASIASTPMTRIV